MTATHRALPLLDALAQPEPSRVTVFEALLHPDADVRAAGVSLAAERLEPEVLVALLAEGEEAVRRSSAMAALLGAGARAVPALLDGARGEALQVQVLCLQLVGRIGAAAALPEVRALVAHPQPLVSQAAIEVLGLQRDQESVPLLVQMLRSHSWPAIAAAVALGRIGGDQARAALVDLLEDSLLGSVAEAALARSSAGNSGRADGSDA